MLLFLMGASTGAAYAVANPGVADVKITQQTGTCKGVVVDATGETVIGASVVVKGTTNGTITGIVVTFPCQVLNKEMLSKFPLWDILPKRLNLKENL